MVKKLIFAISLIVVVSSANSQNYTVKDRWNIKLGYSAYKTFFLTKKFIQFTDDESGVMYKRKSNVRFELNYGVLKWLEVGGYIGLMNYEYITEEIFYSTHQLDYNYPDAFAPTFGVNANIQILPLFVKNQNCKWDFYIPIRYGGCVLPKWGGKYLGCWYSGPVWDNAADENTAVNYNKYRHEYGAGLGGAYYIKNIIGFYMEVLGGQFSYWPELVKSPYNIRVGLTAKF